MFVNVGNWHLVQLFIEDCMFVTSTIKNSEGCYTQNLVAIGHTHGLENTWPLVSVGHSHHSPPLASHSNPHLNGFLYPKPNPPTCPWCTLHQRFLSCQLHIFINRRFFTSKIQRGSETCQFIVAFVILDFSCSSSMVKSALQFASKSWTSLCSDHELQCFESRREINIFKIKLQIQQSLNPTTSTQTQRLTIAMSVLKPRCETIKLS